MGKNNRHSKDRMFITATEWKQEYGGKKTAGSHGYQPLPFDHCALSLTPFQTPVCTPEGVIFDIENLIPYLLKYKKNPVTGEAMSAKDMIKLNIAKNNDEEWHCPVTFKVFNDNSHIVAIRKSGNVYSYEAVNELNIKAKNFTDLISGESFTKSDIITIQDPTNLELMALKDINNFKHLIEVREDSATNRTTESKIRHNPTTIGIMKEIENKRKADEAAGITKKSLSELLQKPEENIEDVAVILALKPLTEDVTPGSIMSEQRMGGSLTSTSETVWTADEMRLAKPDEIRAARFRKMRQIGKKGYAQIQTNVGNLNIEIHCDWAPRTSWNFIALCLKGYYNNVIFHRLVKDFMIQGGDPTGTGTGGDSVWGPDKPFRDEFDSRLKHDVRGVLSMANSGPNTNKSQFFITFRGARHLDLVHCIFGRVVGGAATLDRMEAIGADKKDVPLQEIKITGVEVFTNPIEEADNALMEDIIASMQRRKEAVLPLPITAPRMITATVAEKGNSNATATTIAVALKTVQKRSSTASDIESFIRSQATDGTDVDVHKKKKSKSNYSDFSSW